VSSYGHGELLSALRAAVHRDHRRHRRKLRTTAVRGILLLFVSGAVAVATNMPWWQPETAKAHVLVQARLRYDGYGLTAGSVIALWQAPNSGGGSCLLFGALRKGAPPRGECEQRPGGPVYIDGHPIDIAGGSSELSHGVYNHLVAGSVDPKSGIVRVVLERETGSMTLAFAHGWFLGDTAPTKTVSVPNAYIVGYDAFGHEVARMRVWKH
jgi:hypothetical protein